MLLFADLISEQTSGIQHHGVHSGFLLSLLYLLFLMVRNPTSIYLIYLPTWSLPLSVVVSFWCHPFPCGRLFYPFELQFLGTEHLYLLTDNWLWATEALPSTPVLRSSFSLRISFRTDSFRRGGEAEGKKEGIEWSFIIEWFFQIYLPFMNENIHCAHFEVGRWHWKYPVYIVTCRFKREDNCPVKTLGSITLQKVFIET